MATVATEVIAPKVNRNAVSAITGAIAKGLREVNASGSLLTQCVKIARAQYKGKAIPAQDVNATLDTLCETMQWKGDRTKAGTSASVRCSEYKSVLVNYANLEEAMRAFQQRAGKCTWHDGIALSRLLRKMAPNAAAKQHATRGKSKAASPDKLSRGDAKAQIAAFAKRVFKMTKVEREFRDALRELCSAHSIKV
jgi:hypothetical protein